MTAVQERPVPPSLSSQGRKLGLDFVGEVVEAMQERRLSWRRRSDGLDSGRSVAACIDEWARWSA